MIAFLWIVIIGLSLLVFALACLVASLTGKNGTLARQVRLLKAERDGLVTDCEQAQRERNTSFAIRGQYQKTLVEIAEAIHRHDKGEQEHVVA